MKPLVKSIPYCDPFQLLLQLQTHSSSVVFLDSAQFHSQLGRYSFIAVSPFAELIFDQHTKGNLFDLFQRELNKYDLTPIEGLPPFQGGAAGWFSYDLAARLETIRTYQPNEINAPLLALGLYDLVIAFDHQTQVALIFSSGLPEVVIKNREERAKQRLAWLEELLKSSPPSPLQDRAKEKISIQSNFTKEQYIATTERVLEYIKAGDIFQANIAQKFYTVWSEENSPLSLYQELRAKNPAHFAAYVNLANTTLLSASPERFLKLQQGIVETRPIKGTRPRSSDRTQDQQYAEALLVSPKDRAENTMIVDLLRNDLSRVCEKGSIFVPQLCGLESYPTVHHLVSIIQGQLQSQYNSVDLFKACFPGGSITGAPKIRAMEIIAELEPDHRGPYCGSIGYFGFDGSMDTSIVIRTYVIQNNQLSFNAGGGIVLHSDPVQEYEESWVKAKALIEALDVK